MDLSIVRPADIVAIRGNSLLSHLICDFTGAISHVGLCTGVLSPTLTGIRVTQALSCVKTLTLADTIAQASYAYILHALTLTLAERNAIVAAALAKIGESYDYTDLAWQAMDKTFNTDWFTSHWASRSSVICSEFDGRCYETVGLNFGVPDRDVTPVDIFDFALQNPAKFQIITVKSAAG